MLCCNYVCDMPLSEISPKSDLELVGRFRIELVSKDTVEDVLWAITDNAISELGFEDCVVYLKDKSGTHLVQKAAYGPKTSGKRKIVNPISIPVGVGVVRDVAKMGNAEIVNDCSLDPRYIVDDAQRNSELAVPIIIDGVVIGVIDSEHSQKNFYNQEHLAVLSAIASIAGLRLSQVKSRQSVEKNRDSLAGEVIEKKHELQMAMAELRKSNAKLEQLVLEKNNLLKEYRHRMGNKLQMLQSLINIQSNESDNQEVQFALQLCMSRLRVFSLVNQNADGFTARTSEFLKALNNELHSTFEMYPEAKLEVVIDGENISTEKAVMLGFILIDLVVASIDAFENSLGPVSTIHLQTGKKCEIRFLSNCWQFDKIGEMTNVFIQQIGAQHITESEGLHLICNA